MIATQECWSCVRFDSLGSLTKHLKSMENVALYGCMGAGISCHRMHVLRAFAYKYLCIVDVDDLDFAPRVATYIDTCENIPIESRVIDDFE